jgi:hypothetical protein
MVGMLLKVIPLVQVGVRGDLGPNVLTTLNLSEAQAEVAEARAGWRVRLAKNRAWVNSVDRERDNGASEDPISGILSTGASAVRGALPYRVDRECSL